MSRWRDMFKPWFNSKGGAHVFDYGNNIRAQAVEGGYGEMYPFPGFVPAYIRPLFCEGKGPFRWVALSGDPKDIEVTDKALMELFPDDQPLQRWLTMAGERVAFQACLLVSAGLDTENAKAGAL